MAGTSPAMTPRRAPVVRTFLVVEMTNAGNERVVALLFSPIDRFFLGVESFQHVIGAIFDDIIVNRASLLTALRPRLNINVGHGTLLWVECCQYTRYTSSQ